MISILIPCNNATHLEECLLSFSDVPDREILVWLDGRFENDSQAQEICFRHGASCIFDIDSKDEIGAPAARNRLFDEYVDEDSEYVLFFDADDVRIPGMLQQQVEYLRQHPEWDGVTASMSILWKDVLTTRNDYRAVPQIHCKSIWSMMARRALQTGCVLWRRSSLLRLRDALGEIWDTDVSVLQEYRMMLSALSLGFQVGMCPVHGHYYRWHWSQTQQTQEKWDLYQDSWLSLYVDLMEFAPSEFQELIRSEYEKFRYQVEKERRMRGTGKFTEAMHVELLESLRSGDSTTTFTSP